MKKEFRLTRSTDFKRVRQSGKSYTHPLVVMVAVPNTENRIRIGVAAGRSVGGAVERNRAKRRLRACLSIFLPAIPKEWDLIFLARKPIQEADFDQIQDAVGNVLKRARLLQDADVMVHDRE